MSFKAKNLSYEAAQPAFLQRLRGQVAGADPARHEQPISRNKRMKKDDDEDDAPTYVMEDSNQSLTKAEYEALVAGKDEEEKASGEDETTGKSKSAEDASKESVPHQSMDSIAEVGKAAKKRKAGKIIGGEDEDENDVKKANAKVVKKPKKKAKPVKLTFDDQEEE